MFGKVFKSDRQREMERDIKIQRTLTSHKQTIKKMEKLERDYLAQAHRAKSEGLTANFRQICGMIARVTNQRRACTSQLLSFETMLLARDSAKLFAEFAGGIREMSHSIRDTFKNFNADEVMSDIETMAVQTSQMQSAMDMVLDKISATSETMNESQSDSSDMVSADEIARTINSQFENSAGSIDKDIDAALKSIEQQIRAKEPNVKS